MLAGLRSVVGGVRATLGVRSGSSLVVKEPFRVQSRIVGSRRNVQTDSNGAIATSTGLETPLVATPAPATSPTAKSATSDSIYSISPPELVAILSAMRHPATSTLPRLSNPVYEGKVRGLSFESDYQYHLRLCGHQEISGVAREVTLAWEVANGIDGAATPSLIDGKSSREFLYEVTRWFPYVGDSGIGGILPPQAFKAYIGALHLESGREGTRKLLAPYFHLRLQNLCNLPPSSPHTFPSVTSTSPATPTLTPTSTPTPTPTSMPTPTATPTPTPSTASVPAATATVVILAPFIANPAQSVHLSAPNFVPAVTSTPVTPFHSFSPATPTILEEIRSAMYRPAATEMRLDDDDLGAVVFGATKPRSTRPYSPERLRWVGASEMRGIAVEVCVVLQPSNSTARLLEEAVESITTGALAVGIASRFRWPRGGSASLGELQSFVGATFWQEGRHGTRNLLAPFFYEALMARLDSLPSIASATDELSVSALLPIYSSPSPTSAELLQPTGTAALPPSAESQPSAQKSSTAKSSSVAKPVLKVPTPPKFAPVALPTSSPSSTNTESPPAVDHEPISAQKCDSPSSPAPVLPVAVPSTPSSTPATPPTPVTTAEVQSIPVSTSNSTPPSKSTISASTPSQISTPAPLPTTPKKPIASARVKAAPISTTKSTPSKSTPSKASIKSAAKPSKISVPVVKTAVIPPAKSSTVKSSTIKTSAAKTTAKSTPFKSTPSKASIKSAAKPSKISVPVVKTAVIPPAKSSTVKSSTIKTSAAKTTAKSTPPSPKSSIPSPVPTVF